jgi:hypothetical protein
MTEASFDLMDLWTQSDRDSELLMQHVLLERGEARRIPGVRQRG